MSKEREVLRSAFLGTLVGGLLILVCLLILLGVIVVTPLQQLVAQVERIGHAGDRRARLATTRRDEIGVFAAEFNALLERIEHDIDARDAVTAALGASEKRLATLLDAAPNAVLMLNDQGRIETANPASAELFGLSIEQVQGNHLCDLLPDPAFATGAPWAGSGEAEDTFRGEVDAARADGAVVPVYLVLRTFRLDDNTHCIAVMTDLSEFKRMHAAVLRAHHLASLGEVGATVAHELRNPIAGISNAVEVLRDAFPEGDPRREVLDEMRRQTQRVERTVRSLLDFARPWQVAPEPIPLLPFAREVWQRTHKDIGAAGITIQHEGDDAGIVLADTGLMEQVLRNLYENAVQAMGAAGEIHLSTQATPGGISLRIEDSGPGIPAALRTRVFEPFYTTRTTGVGLGLAVCRTLVEAQGGHMDITNGTNGGALVSIELPAGVAAA